MTPRHSIPTLLTVLLAATAISCSHQELFYSRTAELTIRYQWGNTTGTAGKTTDDIEEMAIYLFPEDGAPLRYYLNGSRGGTIEGIPFGHYKMITFNHDTEVIMTTGESSFDTFGLRATTTSLLSPLGVKSTSTVPRASGSEDEPVTWEIDPVWAGRLTEVNLNPGTESLTVDVPMEECFTAIDITIPDVKNLANATAYSATLDGMAYAYYPGRGTISTATTTIPFAINAQGDATINGHFLTFGHCPDGNTHNHNLVLYFILKDGQKIYYTYDITAAIHTPTALSTGRVRLDNINLAIPEIIGGGSGGSGMNIEVLPWESVEIPIKL